MRDRHLFKRIIPFAAILSLLPLLSACNSSRLGADSQLRPTAPPATAELPTAPPPTATPAGPAITLDPVAGGPRTLLTVVGRGFPAGTRLTIQLGQPNKEPAQEAYGEAIADPTGALTVEFVVPDEWPGGSPITDKQLVVVAAAPDRSVQASALFAYDPAPTSLAGPTGASTPTDESGLNQSTAQAAQDTVSGFLNWLGKDPTGKNSVVYLAANLRAKVQKGQTVSMLLGIQNVYPSFQVTGVEPGEDENTALVRATLNFTPPVQRVFLLAQTDGVWRIADITAGQ